MTEVLSRYSFNFPTVSSGVSSTSLSSSASGSSNGTPLGVKLISWTSLEDDAKRTRTNSLLKRTQSIEDPQGLKRLAGLKNLGNTCFMNSILQCLFHTRPLFTYCLSGHFKFDINPQSSMKGSLITAFASLTEMLCKGNGNVSPEEFKSQIARFAGRYVGYSQQDAQEFLIYLLEGLHEDVNKLPSIVRSNSTPSLASAAAACDVESQQVDSLGDSNAENAWKKHLPKDTNSRIAELFVGILRSTLTCQGCLHVSETFEPFLDLSLPVHCEPKSPSRRSSNTSTSPINQSNGQVSLLECLQLLVQQETLDADNKPECEHCKRRQTCTKSFSIDRFPPILILHLKRFNQGNNNNLYKVSTEVDCPLSKLDLTRYATHTNNTSAVYNLYATCSHSGSATDGHYTAYARHTNSNQWYCFDDVRVTAVDSSSVVTADTYILFYELSETTSSRL